MQSVSLLITFLVEEYQSYWHLGSAHLIGGIWLSSDDIVTYQGLVY